jgi:hypothetical protein
MVIANSFVLLVLSGGNSWYNKNKREHSTNMWEKYIDISQAYRFLRVKADNEKGSLDFAEFTTCGYHA